jgi:hypothetical protein
MIPGFHFLNQRSVKTVNSYTCTKQAKSARNLIAAVFLDKKGVLMVEFMQHGTTITSEVYCKTLNELCRAIQNKRDGTLTSGEMFLHDNVCPHTGACTGALIKHFSWELFDHPPYSLYLAPCGCQLF